MIRSVQDSGTSGTNRLFVVERYDDTGTPGRLEPLPVPPPDVNLVWAVRLPADDVVLVLVEGTDELTISTSLAEAGWRVDRITPATWARPVEVSAVATG